MSDSTDLEELRKFAESLQPVVDGMSLQDLAAEMKTIKNKLNLAKEIQTRFQKRYDLIRKVWLPKKMEEEETEFTRFKGIGSLGLTADMYVKILPGKQGEFYQWLRDRGHEDIITSGVHHKRLQSYIKECIQHGEEIPDDLVKIIPFEKATLSDR